MADRVLTREEIRQQVLLYAQDPAAWMDRRNSHVFCVEIIEGKRTFDPCVWGTLPRVVSPL